MKARVTFNIDVRPIKTKRGGITEMSDDMMEYFKSHFEVKIGDLADLFRTNEGSFEDVLLTLDIDYNTIIIDFESK